MLVGEARREADRSGTPQENVCAGAEAVGQGGDLQDDS